MKNNQYIWIRKIGNTGRFVCGIGDNLRLGIDDAVMRDEKEDRDAVNALLYPEEIAQILGN